MTVWMVWAFLGMGVFFGIMGNAGVLIFPDIYTRLQASAKCSTTSVLSVFIACMLIGRISPLTGRIIVIALFVLITGPVTSHIIGRCAFKRGVVPWIRKSAKK